MPSRLPPDTVRAAIRAFRETGATRAEEDTILAAAEQWADHAPPAGLPATLGSVDDVRQVCEAAGLTADDHAWSDGAVIVSTWGSDFAFVVVYDERSGARLAQVFPDAPGALLWHVIQAARTAT